MPQKAQGIVLAVSAARCCIRSKLLFRHCLIQRLMTPCCGMCSEGGLCRWQLQDKPALDWHTLMDKKNKELKRLSELYQKNLKSAGVEQFEGRGTITGKEEVSVNGKSYKVAINVQFHRSISLPVV